MEFHSWQTMIDEYRRFHGKDKSVRALSDREILEIERQNIVSSSFKDESNRLKRIIRLMLEYTWMKDGRPYYNIHPQMVSSLCKTNLDKIPAEFIEMPNKFKSVCFRFSNDVPIRKTGNNGLSLVMDESVATFPIYCRSVLFTLVDVDQPAVSWLKKNEIDLANGQYQNLVGSRQLNMFIDEGFRLENGIDRLLCNNISLIIRKEQTIPEAIEDQLTHLKNENEKMMMLSMGERLVNLFKVIISAGFLANTPEERLVVPDVLARDKDNYTDAVKRGDQAKIEEILTRARSRDKLGYNVGTNEMFIGETNPTKTDRTVTGKELEYSHIRGGHPHAVRYGEGKKLVKIKWYRPMRIREDLPFRLEETE